MTTKDQFKKMLEDLGVFESQAEKILDLAMPKFKELMPQYNITWDRDSTEYPNAFYNVGFLMVIKPSALEWIDANLPKAWFRPLFAE